ncbi:MAG: hypothetical protein QHH24_02760 [Candidatus Bathyarchaeota archaeon]|nr:hypothetical protein [Candidatus Bathyarchaeota archaeon]
MKNVSYKMEKELVELLRKVCKARGETVSGFTRRAVLIELAKLGYLDGEGRKALGFGGESHG